MTNQDLIDDIRSSLRGARSSTSGYFNPDDTRTKREQNTLQRIRNAESKLTELEGRLQAIETAQENAR